MTYQEAKKAEREGRQVNYYGEPAYIIKSSDDRNLFQIEIGTVFGEEEVSARKERKIVTSYELEG